MGLTFRWYGSEEERITLDEIRQIPGVKGIVGCLMDIPVGEVWPEDRIAVLVKQVEDKGLTLKVIESVNIHDDIKVGLPSRDRYIENYKQTICNLAKYGVKCICYNFMPVFDWVKSDLDYVLPDGSHMLVFERKEIPDDPPYGMFGLPRIIKNREDLDWLCNAVNTPYNGITLCCGSIAEEPANDVYSILAEFSRRGCIHFVHMRNICYLHSEDPANKDFYESAHPSEYGSKDMVKMMKALHDSGFDGFIRPDHGRMIWGETGRPGYGLYDRALGCAYINGVWETLDKLS